MLNPGDAADCQQRDVMHGQAIAQSDETVGQLMPCDADKDRSQKEGAEEGTTKPVARLDSPEIDHPGEGEDKCRMKAYGYPSDGRDFNSRPQRR